MEGAGHELGYIFQKGPQNATEILGLESADGACTLGTFRNRFHLIV